MATGGFEHLRDDPVYNALPKSMVYQCIMAGDSVVPDLVQVATLLTTVGYNLTKVESLSKLDSGHTQYRIPEKKKGTTIEISCTESNLKVTLSSMEAVCRCPVNSGSSWSVTWSGATAGQPSMKVNGDEGDRKGSEYRYKKPIASNVQEPIIPTLSDDATKVVKNTLGWLINALWPSPKNEPYITAERLGDRLFRSMESIPTDYSNQKAVFESSKSLQSISLKTSDRISIENIPSIFKRSVEDVRHPLLESSDVSSAGGNKNNASNTNVLNQRAVIESTKRLQIISMHTTDKVTVETGTNHLRNARGVNHPLGDYIDKSPAGINKNEVSKAISVEALPSIVQSSTEDVSRCSESSDASSAESNKKIVSKSAKSTGNIKKTNNQRQSLPSQSNLFSKKSKEEPENSTTRRWKYDEMLKERESLKNRRK